MKIQTEKNINKKQATFIDWTLDTLLYIVILNLFAQYNSDIYFETFLYSILTALLMKAILVAIGSIEHKVVAFFKNKGTKAMLYLGYFIAFLILFFSKFFILELIDIIFKEKVEIHGFITLIVMILTMIISRVVIDKTFDKLGDK